MSKKKIVPMNYKELVLSIKSNVSELTGLSIDLRDRVDFPHDLTYKIVHKTSQELWNNTAELVKIAPYVRKLQSENKLLRERLEREQNKVSSATRVNNQWLKYLTDDDRKVYDMLYSRANSKKHYLDKKSRENKGE